MSSHRFDIAPTPTPTPAAAAAAAAVYTHLRVDRIVKPLDLEPVFCDGLLLRLCQVVCINGDLRSREPFPSVDVVVGQGAEPNGGVDDDSVIHVLGWERVLVC